MENRMTLAKFRSIMETQAKQDVKEIYTKLYGELDPDCDGCYELDFSDITKYQAVVTLEDSYQEICDDVIVDSIIVIGNGNIYLTGHIEFGDEVNEISFEQLNTDDLNRICELIQNKNYTL